MSSMSPSVSIVRLRPNLTTRSDTAMRAMAPPLLFGLRLWASASLALYVVFWLQLDDPFWAGTSAALSAGHSPARRCAKAGSG